MTATPFRIDVPQARLDRIQAQLAVAEVGYAPADDAGWAYGTDAAWLASLLDHWRTAYDWRRIERRLNGLPHYQATIDGHRIHFIHARGAGGKARLPLILTHGWPGSVLEFLDVIEPLAAMGFDLVIPSLPGYGFSGRPAVPIGPRKVAALWRALMVDTLGYARFGAQGGDWGAGVTTWLGRDHADVVAAIHLNLLPPPPPTPDDDEATRDYHQRTAAVLARESAYMLEQATKPQTIGLALAASPLAFAAWACEKYQGWADTGGDIESRFSKDALLDMIMTYLVNDAVQSAIWMYRGAGGEARTGPRVAVPTGVALFPREFYPYPPRAAAERAYAITRWTGMEAGGHFAAWEEPAAFAAEVGAFFAASG